jgi:GNAT superfamily N-acetyltransferase
MTGALRERALTLADLPAALRLSMQAGWNQVEDDWRAMLEGGWALGRAGPEPGASELIATALTVPLGARLAWISMVLVDQAWRRRGLGTRLLQRCIAQLSGEGVTAGLDATPAGRLVYAPLGFQPLYGIARLILEPGADLGGGLAAAPPGDLAVRPLAAADLAGLAEWDAARSFMRRDRLLADLHRRLPAAAWLATRAGAIAGFALGRNGRLSNQLGPVMADDAATARALLGAALRATGRAAILDLPERHGEFHAWLRAAGAQPQRDYTRMLLGPPGALPPPDNLFAIAGPELG